MDSENPADHVFVDLNAEGQSHLLGNPLAAPGTIAPFHFNDRVARTMITMACSKRVKMSRMLKMISDRRSSKFRAFAEFATHRLGMSCEEQICKNRTLA
jgi:hypothetical protein